MGGAYYNEIDPFAAEWLRNLIKAGLIADGEVDTRSIVDVRPVDLRRFVQCHFFAGIGIWSHALRSAGWPDDRPVWTGSCPCQGLSTATRGRPRQVDLWPYLRDLVAAERPGTFFGEQVAKAGWIDRASADLEDLGYAVGCAVLPALMVGQDHPRPRAYFVGHANRDGQSIGTVDAEMAGMQRGRRHAIGVALEDDHPRRVGVMRAYGNAIVGDVATAFIEAVMEAP